jgi:2-polyprenyl-3-methyl-5-hydroxy-6-metoxy-1,4-benzoquinol methylase
MTPAVSDVQALFNRKARSWQSNYRPCGKLNSRLDQFVARLSELCPSPGNILDLGCGTGDISSAISRMGYRVTACDIAENMLVIARSNWTRVPVKWVPLKPDWAILPFKNGGFDGIVTSSVFEYLTDVEGVALELSRVLRPGGILIFSVPNPCNHIRKVEAWLRSRSLHHTLSSLFCKFPRVRSYLTYLLLSRNRSRGGWWESVLAAAGFVPLDKKDFSEESWLDKANAPLILLAVKRR